MGNTPQLGQYSTTPIFNTKAVARETEVPADTFRAWERRYGIPRPQRTAGGYRLYSEHDIAIIRWLRDRTAEGMNISQAVMLLNSSLTSAAEEKAGASSQPLPPAPPVVEPRDMRRLVDSFVAALIGFDSARADRTLSEAFTLYPFEEVLLHMIQPAMIEIGERWHHGEINVVVEHFTTQFIRRKLSGMLNMFEREHGRAKIVVACAPDELHDLGALFVALFLVRRGWHVIYLGPQVPMQDLLETISTLTPDMVCLSASMPETAIQLAEVARAIQSVFPAVVISYGGRAFNQNPELTSAITGAQLAHDPQELSDNLAALLGRSSTSAVEF